MAGIAWDCAMRRGIVAKVNGRVGGRIDNRIGHQKKENQRRHAYHQFSILTLTRERMRLCCREPTYPSREPSMLRPSSMGHASVVMAQPERPSQRSRSGSSNETIPSRVCHWSGLCGRGQDMGNRPEIAPNIRCPPKPDARRPDKPNSLGWCPSLSR